MTLLLALGACIAAIAVVAIIAIRLLLKKKSKELTLRIKSITPFQANQESSERTLRRENDSFFQDIESDLEQAFNGRYITFREGKQFMEYYIESFNEVNDFLKRIETFHVEPSETIAKFVSDFENLQWFIKNHNTRYTKEELDIHKDFFDHCLKYPLDKQQRRSIVSEEDNCLVVSSAGSGKTSSIVGKVKYLIEIKGVDPEKILLISYTNKAAAELTDRMGIEGLRGYTFHKLALNIIGQVTGQKPSICSNTDALFLKIYQELLGDDNFKKSVVEYFFDYQIQEQDWERQKNERRQQLSAQKDTRLKAQFPDMDGKTVYVRSEQEQKICLALSLLGVKFRYEEPYEHPLADEMHSQ